MGSDGASKTTADEIGKVTLLEFHRYGDFYNYYVSKLEIMEFDLGLVKYF